MTAAAQGLTPPRYTKAEVVAATTSCLETIRKLEANTTQFPMPEFGSPLQEDPTSLLTTCIVDRLEKSDFEVIPLS